MAHGEHHLHLPHSFHELVHPHSGKKLHVARSPTEAKALRKSLSTHPDNEIDVCLHGSDEHIEFLQQLADHQDTQRDAIRDKHGEVFNEVENVLLASTNLAKELERARNQGINLEMNFNKYGVC